MSDDQSGFPRAVHPEQEACGSKGETRTPTQWLASDGATDPMALLAGGMAQLQAVMLRQMKEKDKDGDQSPETVKPGSTALPQLPDVDPLTSSVDIMDWLEVITTTMQDLSDGSAEWWSRVRALANEAYSRWTSASPVEKLGIVPPREDALESGKWSRVNSRAASMVLMAVPTAVKQELVQRRSTGSVTSLLFRLLTIYQPGGQQEKVTILQGLQQPKSEQTAADAVRSLRAWARWLRRCRELEVAAPDPSLLTRGLSLITRSVLEKEPEVSFRTSLVKSHLLVDTKPSYDSVEKYYHHLLAECESLAVASSTITTSPATTTVTPAKPEPKMRPLKPERTSTTTGTPTATAPPGPSRSSSQSTAKSEGETLERTADEKAKVPCKFFAKTYKGCARAGRCPFLHSWEGVEKTGRCLACGGKNHSAKDCPNKKSNSQADTSSTPTSPQRTTSTRPSSSTATAPTTSNKNVRIDENPQVEPIPARSTSSSATTGADSVDLKEVLADVGKMLKAMTATNLKAIRVQERCDQVLDDTVMKRAAEETFGETEGTGLLDSGASHPMRPADHEEYAQGQPVRVTLAGEDVRVLRQNDRGTILVQESSPSIQPIVPLGAVIENLGYTLHWSPKNLRLVHPNKKAIQVRIKNHCPEIATIDALNLIQELEMKNVHELNVQVESLKARLEVIKKEETREWWELLREYARTGERPVLLKAILTSPITKDLPADVQNLLLEDFRVEDGEKYMKLLPLSRRRRRALLSSRSWVVNLFSGDCEVKNDPFQAISLAGKTQLNVDLASSKLWDLHRESGVYRLLMWAAATGRISDIIASPPHRTWPTSSAPTRGPEAYLQRTDTEPYGVKDLTSFQRQKVDAETASIAKQLLLWFVAQMAGKRDVGFLMEFPADAEYLRRESTYDASVWKTEMWKNFSTISGIKEISFYMGSYGHRALRPTTMATTYPALNQLEQKGQERIKRTPSTLLNQAEMRKWSIPFKEIVAEAIADYHSGRWNEEEEIVNAGARVHKLTKDQREAWHRHLMNDHQPYRADCSVCINAQATGYQHRRRLHPTMYTMALDLAGPFKQKGRDMDHDDYKYIMVAAYRCPKEYMNEKALAELDMDLYVPDEPSEVEGKDPMEMVGEILPIEDGASDLEDEEENHNLEPHGPETMDDAVEALAHPEEWATVYITRPLRGRTTQYVLQAAKEILLQLRQSGLHVGVLHTDRAREFKAKAFKSWTVDSQLRHTRTAGGDPAANSSAELGIRWAKSRVRSLLSASRAPAKEWPMAIQHASSALWAKAFPDSPWTAGPATFFGNEVWFRSKVYKGKREKKHEANGSRWKKGWYRGPALDVKRGHLIAREDGGLTIAKGIRSGIVEPEVELKGVPSPVVAADLMEEREMEVPTRTELKDEVEFRARKYLEDEVFDLDRAKELFELLELLGDTDKRLGRKTKMSSWYTGAFVHGGVAGARSNTKDFPFTTRYLTRFARFHCGEVKFTALGLAKNAQLGLHRDVHNYKFSRNYVLPLQNFEGGGLWVQDDGVGDQECVRKELPNGKEALEDAGFNVDREALSEPEEEIDEAHRGEEPTDGIRRPSVKVLKVNNSPEEHEVCFFHEIDEEEFQVTGNGSFSTTSEFSKEPFLKKAEVQYTAGIETILSDLKESGKALEVTHNVSLGEVKKNLGSWKASALKEYHNLKDVKRIVPCKGVYTVKPDKGGEGFRRKTRFVACGNHVPEEETCFDLFAAGVDATSLRSILAVNSRKPWRIGTTDVRQAFVLAKWLGQPVALEPPSIAYELEIASPGDLWYVEQAIYGLRESPALWSQFRDENLKGATWTAEISGGQVSMRLQQLVSDNQIWRITDDQDGSVTYGYIVVYIDDLLIYSQEEAMYGFFNWVSAKWEVDALDILDYDHPIRFLGMELHRVPGGVELSQEGFINEILRSYKHQGGRSQTQGARETLLLSDEEERALIDAEVTTVDMKSQVVKEAQRRVGELLWLTGRTRPDLQHTVSIMAARITPCPEMVNKLGARLLDYLNETKFYRLALTQEQDEAYQEIDVFTDSSFAPSGGRSQGAAAIFLGKSPLVWRSGRQQLVTLSTAESELLEAVEGAVLGLSSRGLLTELLGRELPLNIWVDNSAAISLLTTSSGSWRTRHLRLRSNWVREMASKKELYIKFVPGELQRADLGTKPFTRERLKQLVGLWHIVDRRTTMELRTVRFLDEIIYMFTGNDGACDMLAMFKGRAYAQTKLASKLYNPEMQGECTERAESAILSLIALVRGNYEAYTSPQKPAARLTPEQWQHLQSVVVWASPGREKLLAAILLLAVRGIGKCRSVTHQLPPQHQRPDQAVLFILDHFPDAVPSIYSVAEDVRHLLDDTLELQQNFIFAQMLQGENVPANLMQLKDFINQRSGEETLKFYVIFLLGFLSGLAGGQGSRFMTHNNAKTTILGLSIMKQVLSKDPTAIYWTYINNRGVQLGRNAKSTEDLAVLRLACLCRAQTDKDLSELQSSWDQLSKTDRKELVKHFLADGIVSRAVVLEFLPLCLERAKKNAFVTVPTLLEVLVELLRAVRATVPGAGQIVSVDLADFAAFILMVQNGFVFQTCLSRSKLQVKESRCTLEMTQENWRRVSEPHTDVVLLADSVRDLVQTRKREKAEKEDTVQPLALAPAVMSCRF
ncbi:Copia protein [Symbiodinium microadriaticum]|uniref:Copia protein n=1 Tax=Symbiodinium microadriaticum TaxID=2951 RepID=A0A1Q9EE99_SYMMI|nr:Copia protein [Symbiodinium microadriaticum]